MKNTLIIVGFALFFAFGYYFNNIKNNNIEKNEITNSNTVIKKVNNMVLGAFSVSISVKDINISKEFYEKLGYVKIGGALDKNYLIMKNENSVIGLFQGMFEGNILTFNPGWNENGKDIDTYTDIREIQQVLKDNGIDIGTEIEKETSGPASFMTADPDGNVILFDQHR